MFVVMMTLFALLVVGYVAGKYGYLGGDFDRQLSKLVINITCPALILSSAMNGELPDRQYILPLLGISVVTYVLLTGVALWLPRYLTRRQEEEGTVGFAIMFGNVGFMGYPVVASLFGHQAVFYAAVLNVINTFAVFTPSLPPCSSSARRCRNSPHAHCLATAPSISPPSCVWWSYPWPCISCSRPSASPRW